MEEERVGLFAPLRRPPQRLLASALPWLAVLYLVTSLLLAAASFACLIAFPLIPLWGRVLGWVEEWRARALLPEGRDEPPPGWRDAKRWMWRVLTWRQTALVLVNASAGFLVFFLITAALTAFVCSLRLAAGLGVRIGGERIVLAGPHPAWATIALSLLAVACNVLLVYALVACALAQAWVSRGLFRADTEAMERQITLLSQRNLGLVEAFEAERQRIERELHDGAQQHLASAAIQLGLAQAGLAGRSAADGHLEAAHGEVEAASAAMRRALAGLRPRTLLERGLGADISEMAAGAPISVSVRYDVPGRLDPAVEASLHFVVSEFLANAYRHAGASSARVSFDYAGGLLSVDMSDDGVGGADPRGGTGIVGMANRIRLMGGQMSLDSPPGGPTRLRASCPAPLAAEEDRTSGRGHPPLAAARPERGGE